VTRHYRTLGTLCDEPNGLTSSFHVAKGLGRHDELAGFPTFEMAAEAVKAGAIEACLVPAAYPLTYRFIMDASLEAVETCLAAVPDVVLVSTRAEMPPAIETLFQHPATEPLSRELGRPVHRHEFTTSNSAACVQLLGYGSQDGMAITNALCAAYYRLTTHMVLRRQLQMPFICFGRRSGRR
jgi:hypothetical protein